MIIVITPAKEWNADLAETLYSVREQTKSVDMRHIVIMDNQDPLPKAKIGEGYQLEFIRNIYTQGPSGARNTGLDQAKQGDIVFFIDGDDLWPRNYLKTILGEYANYPNAQAVACRGVTFGIASKSGEISSPLLDSGFIQNDDIAWNAIGCPSGFSYRIYPENQDIRFPEELRLCEDYAFYLMLAGSNPRPIRALSHQIYLYRRSPRQTTATLNKKFIENQRKNLRELIGRKRANEESPLLISHWKEIDRRMALTNCNLVKRTYLYLGLARKHPKWLLAQIRRSAQNCKSIKNEPATDRLRDTILQGFQNSPSDSIDQTTQ